MSKIKLIIIVVALVGFSLCSAAKKPGTAPALHCSEDSVILLQLIEKVSNDGGNTLGSRTMTAAKAMADLNIKAIDGKDTVETVEINFHSASPLSFINNAIAIAKTANLTSPTVEDFSSRLENISFRKGENTGFASKLFYGADWIVDNVYRGNLEEKTEYMTGGGFKVKSLDYLSRHKEEFPALKDSLTLEQVKTMEMGLKSHRIPHLKKQSAGNKPLHELMNDGDIIIMLSPETEFDVYDMGVIEMREGVPYLIHVSKGEGKVVADPYPLPRLFKLEGQHFYGYRWLRPTE